MWYFPYIFAGCNWFSYDFATMNNVKNIIVLLQYYDKDNKKEKGTRRN